MRRDLTRRVVNACCMVATPVVVAELLETVPKRLVEIAGA
jgi:hypothetical protein